MKCRVSIKLNVNHSVDADVVEEAELNAKADNPPTPEMKSRPQFEVKLVKGSKTTRFACSFIHDEGEPVEEGPSKSIVYLKQSCIRRSLFFRKDDVFSIDELTVFEGEHNDQTYAVAGDILDGVSLIPSYICFNSGIIIVVVNGFCVHEFHRCLVFPRYFYSTCTTS